MGTEKDRYDELLNILRESKPELKNSKEIEDSIISMLSKRVDNEFRFSDMMEFLFGWTYIGWVRRSLITASVILVAIFVWQQRILISQINQLNRQVNSRETTYDPSGILQEKLLFNRLSEQDLRPLTNRGKLIDSMNSLQLRYHDIMKLIDNDQELRKMVERKISEQNKTRFKL